MRHHTRHPWTIDRRGNGTFIRGAGGGLIASMEAGSQIMREADSRFIVQAPALLYALERFLPLALLEYERQHPGETDPLYMAQEVKDALNALRNAGGMVP